MGGTKMKKYERGAAVAFVSRNKALKKLQLSLPDFRALCIFKGIYPVEPKHKKKANKGSTAIKTYYNAKDIRFLTHEPLIAKFREKKHYVRRLKKAMAKKNTFTESIIRDNKPVYGLKTIIKERYPTFTDALRDLDDCLNLCFMFSCLPNSRHIHRERVQLCHKRTVEFLHYVMAAKALRKVFVSIKGIYYQADIKGETVTWVVSHKRGHQQPQEVDFKIMQTFAEYYSVLLGHINIKLFSDVQLRYPPQLEEPHASNIDTADEGLVCLSLPICRSGDVVEEEENDPEVDSMNAATSEDPDFVEKSKLEAEAVSRLQGLFKKLKFFLGREVPREELTFMIRCCSGSVSWDATVGAGATYPEDDATITHQIVDRPVLMNQRLDRTYVQPQWVFDCINGRVLLPVKDYFPGVPCPPHLSPFTAEREGEYVPEEKVKFLQRMAGEEPLDEEDEEESDDYDDEEESDDERNEGRTDVGKKRKRPEEEDSDEEEDSKSTKKPKTANMKVTSGKIERVDQQKALARQQAEDKRLGEMMIPKKHKRLYKKIMTSRKKTSQETRKLQEKKASLVEKEKKTKKQKKAK